MEYIFTSQRDPSHKFGSIENTSLSEYFPWQFENHKNIALREVELHWQIVQPKNKEKLIAVQVMD